MLKQLGNSHANIGVTCKTPEDLRLVAETLPRAELHYDGGDLSAERIREITEIARGRELQHAFAVELGRGLDQEDLEHFRRCVAVFDRNIDRLRGSVPRAARSEEAE